MRRGSLLVFAASVALALPAFGGEDDAFQKRFAALKSKKSLVVVKMKPTEDPANVPATAAGGVTLVSGSRMGIYTPPLLSPEDMLAVVNQHMVDVRKCYKKQLEADPEWADNLILDLAVKKNGRVAEVAIAPSRVRRDPIGQCLMSSIPKWTFPEFTGETEDGITQEVVNASFPFSFSSK